MATALDAFTLAADLLDPPKTGALKYHDDPAGFMRDCIRWNHGQGPTDYQLRNAELLVEKHRLAIRGPHGLGKTGSASWLILWFALTRDAAGEDWKIPTTASAWRQLTKYLWPEVRKWSRQLDWEKLGRKPFTSLELQQLGLKLTYGEAFAVACSDPATIEGVHADQVLYVYDEAKTIPDATFDATEGAFSGAGANDHQQAYALASSTPGPPVGRFYDIHKRKPGLEDWTAVHVTLEDTIRAGRVSREWAEQRAKQWGSESAVYKNRVAGEFASSEEDGVIPLAWIELANERWHNLPELTEKDDLDAVGVDVARSGPDQTILALRYGHAIRDIRRYSKQGTMDTAGRVHGILQAAHHPARQVTAVVDVIGIGAGVVDRLRETSLERIVGFNASEKSDRKDRSGELGFVNCLTGDDRVQPVGDLRRIYRSPYEGPLIQVETASGDHFTATPNHQVLTADGWVTVESLSAGDKLCDSSLRDAALDAPVRPEIDHMPATLRELYGAANRLFGSERMKRGAVDFHGDRPVGEVDVVTIDRELLRAGPAWGEQAKDVHLLRALIGPRAFAGGRALAQPGSVGHLRPGVDAALPHDSVLRCALQPLSRRQTVVDEVVGLGVLAQLDAVGVQRTGDRPFMSAERQTKTLDRLASAVSIYQRRRIGYDAAQQHRRFGLATWLDAALFQHSPGYAPLDPIALRQRVKRLASEIPTDEVIGVKVLPSSRHFVYTLETTTGAYASGRTVHRNCRAAAWWNLREMLDPDSGLEVALPPDDALTGDLTSPTWRVMSGGRIQIESKDDIRKRLGRSTDDGDAVVQAFWPEGTVAASLDRFGRDKDASFFASEPASSRWKIE